eukprot:1807411-Pleurochrysis_carterae.AAC.1
MDRLTKTKRGHCTTKRRRFLATTRSTTARKRSSGRRITRCAPHAGHTHQPKASLAPRTPPLLGTLFKT